MTDSPRPTLARRHLGRLLRRLRLEAGKTHDDVKAARLGSRTKMWAIENGQVSVGADTIYGLSALYDLSSEMRDQLLALAAATKRTGVQEPLSSAIPERFSIYGELVDAASMLRIHSVELIHGLLQTEDYARAVIRSDPALTPDDVEQRVAFRLRRQAAYLRRSDPGRLEVIITAGVLNLNVGSPGVMEAEFAHLRTLDQTDQVSVRVLTTTDGVHPSMRGGGFALMEFDDPLDPPLVYLEQIHGVQYVERTDHLDLYRRVFGGIANMAVPLREYHP